LPITFRRRRGSLVAIPVAVLWPLRRVAAHGDLSRYLRSYCCDYCLAVWPCSAAARGTTVPQVRQRENGGACAHVLHLSRDKLKPRRCGVADRWVQHGRHFETHSIGHGEHRLHSFPALSPPAQEPRMQLRHSQKHVRVVDELISWSIVPHASPLDLYSARGLSTGGLVSNPALQSSG